jgi:hypothetical protein
MSLVGTTFNCTVTDTKLTQEEVEDYVGGMVTGNTETLITVTYQDGDGTLDFVVNNDLSQYSNATSGFLTALPASALEWSDTTASSGVGIATYDDIRGMVEWSDTTASSGVGIATYDDVRAKLGNVVEDTSPQLGGNLDLNEKNIQLIAAPSADHTTSGNIITLTAGEALAFGDVCYMHTDGKMKKGDADAVATAFCWAMALASIDNNATGSFALPGTIVRDDTWNWGTLGQPVYLSTTPGELTQTAPSGTADVVQIIGIATHADRILFYPQLVQVEIE